MEDGKHKGGRGRRSLNKYERFAISMDPDLFQRINDFAEVKMLTRSEAISMLVETGFKFTKGKKKKE